MIWVLLFTLIFSSSIDQFYFLTDSSDIIKSHIKDNEKQTDLLLMLSESKTEKDELDFSEKTMVEQLEQLFSSRSTTQQEFQELNMELKTIHAFVKKNNLRLNQELQDNLTTADWLAMKPDIIADIQKRDIKTEKSLKKTARYFNKFEKAIEKTITDRAKADIAILALHRFQSSFNLRINEHRVQIINSFESNSLDDFSNTKLAELFDEDLKNFEDVLSSCLELHSTLVEQTTEKEWKRLQKKLKLPF